MKKEADSEYDSFLDNDSPLKLFLRNLSPNLSNEVRESWIEPDSFSKEVFLGKGKNYVVLIFAYN